MFPPMPTPAEVLRRAAALQGSANDNVRDQHLVSRVLLRKFEEPDPRDGVNKVCSFDLEHPSSSRLRPVSGCGNPVFDFVPFASRSVERRWGDIETVLPATLDAIDSGTFYADPVHASRIRDLIVLHFIRSIQSDVIRWRTWEPMHATFEKIWRDNPVALENLSRTRPGLYVAGAIGQEATLRDLHAQTVSLMESGAYFRVMIEDRFDRMRTWVQAADVEILTPSSGEFLIGDIPALLMLPGYIGSGALDGVGVLPAESIMLPLGPRHLAKLGGAAQVTAIPPDTVNSLNEAQVKAAFARVYLRPGSGLEQSARAVSRPRPSAGPLHDAYGRYRR
jgi:Protein of unknown function (DUF4238)